MENAGSVSFGGTKGSRAQHGSERRVRLISFARTQNRTSMHFALSTKRIGVFLIVMESKRRQTTPDYLKFSTVRAAFSR
jgi:hypothetical protein